MGLAQRQSQIVNNFFTFASIIIIAICLTLYVKYGPKEKRVHSNLECQKITTTSDKVFNQKLLDEGFALLLKGKYRLDGGFLEPKFGKSYLKDEISLKEADIFYMKALNVPQNSSIKYLNIKYEIIENDKNDPRKKDKSCKLYAGSVITSFRINGKESFRMYTDFLQYDKKEIQNKIECTINAFKHNAKK